MKKKAIVGLGKIALSRVTGSGVSLVQAQVASAVVGVAAAVATYKVLRSGD